VSAPDWVDSAVREVADAPPLNDAQVWRLIRLTEVLRGDPALLEQIAHIKRHIEREEYEDAQCLYDELTAEEKVATWVAPKFGGIFTTFERKVLKNLHKEQTDE